MKHIGKYGLTGKVDIDGTEIVDGDILEHCNHEKNPHPPHLYLVEWDNDDAGFKCENGSNYMLACVWCEMRVVGNRCSNPELLAECK